MATVNTQLKTTSFANGEISSRARWKSHSEQFQSGCLALRNFITGDYGEIARRPGVCITANPQLVNGIPGDLRWSYACVLEDKDTGERKQVIAYKTTGGAFGVADATFVKNQHPDFGGVETSDISYVYADSGTTTSGGTVVIGEGKLRHASYAGEEYFVGADTTPFKLSLSKGVVKISRLDFAVEPMRDTETGSSTTFNVEMTYPDGEDKDSPDAKANYTITVAGDLPFEMNGDGLRGHTIMLVNYDAEANYSKKLKWAADADKATETQISDGQAAGWESPVFPAYGTVTLTAEGSYWAGKITLVERVYNDDGSSYEEKDLGSIVASGITATRTLPVTITDLRSEVYVRLDEFYNTPTYVGNTDYKDLGVTVSLSMTGAQEVFFTITDADYDTNVLNVVPINKPRMSFKTTTYAVSALIPPVGASNWSVGVRSICVFQDRLVFGGTTFEPKKIWMSKTGKPLMFKLGTYDNEALSVSVTGSDDEEICWMSPREGLVIGTTNREYVLSGSSNPAITPTSINVSKPNGTSAYGSENTESYNGEEGIFCLRAGGKDLLFYKYSADTYSYVPAVLNNVNLEIFGDGGATEIAVVTRPRTMVYVLRSDGKVACLRYFGANGVIGWSVLSFPYKVKQIFTARESGLNQDRLYLLFEGISNEIYSALGVLCDGEYADRLWVRDLVDKKSSYVSEVHITPWLLGQSDAWGRKVSVNKTTLCMNTARRFETSLDQGRTWTQENLSRDTETGEQKVLTDEEYELRSMSGWRPQAELWLRTDDRHELILNAVRAGLTIA